ncbi:MAG: TM2 domain-containing protein [Bacteroidia bacterium]|nr:TM2 domain-containing protein [Bacteroidia bacterium]
MDVQKVDLFLLTKGNNFESIDLPYVREQLIKMDEEKWPRLQAMHFKNPMAMLIISLLAGPLGVDRFLIGDIGLGVGKLITCGGFGVWAIVDWFLIMQATRTKILKCSIHFNNRVKKKPVYFYDWRMDCWYYLPLFTYE